MKLKDVGHDGLSIEEEARTAMSVLAHQDRVVFVEDFLVDGEKVGALVVELASHAAGLPK